ncbi:hypothetical protein [Flavobacterium eburneipallidum]|uniref:hypothetical protein n=1 Tax=Flavobacterium eburneipallidum TaxID=3003263 RepID=UPI0022AC4AC8|nr:hypothetical protein [Flavobacterium eburneipallidum]
MILQKNSKKCFTYLIPILILILANSCKKYETNSKINIKKKFYRILSQDNQLLSYNYRIYHFENDTMREKCVTISLEGKIKDSLNNKYLIKGTKIYLLLKINNKINKKLYFSTIKVDSCYNVFQKFDKVKICYKGLKNEGKYKNAYEIYYEEIAYDGSHENLIFDKDFTLISRFCNNNTFKKEILINNTYVPLKIKISASKINE